MRCEEYDGKTRARIKYLNPLSKKNADAVNEDSDDDEDMPF